MSGHNQWRNSRRLSQSACCDMGEGRGRSEKQHARKFHPTESSSLCFVWIFIADTQSNKPQEAVVHRGFRTPHHVCPRPLADITLFFLLFTIINQADRSERSSVEQTPDRWAKATRQMLTHVDSYLSPRHNLWLCFLPEFCVMYHSPLTPKMDLTLMRSWWLKLRNWCPKLSKNRFLGWIQECTNLPNSQLYCLVVISALWRKRRNTALYEETSPLNYERVDDIFKLCKNMISQPRAPEHQEGFFFPGDNETFTEVPPGICSHITPSSRTPSLAERAFSSSFALQRPCTVTQEFI